MLPELNSVNDPKPATVSWPAPLTTPLKITLSLTVSESLPATVTGPLKVKPLEVLAVPSAALAARVTLPLSTIELASVRSEASDISVPLMSVTVPVPRALPLAKIRLPLASTVPPE